METTSTANVLPFGKRPPAFDRRRRPRIPALHLSVRAHSERLQILDMSSQGMALEGPHPLAIGGTYLFELVDENRSLRIDGRVCWCQPVDLQSEPRPRFRIGIALEGIQGRTVLVPAAEPAEVSLPVAEPTLADEQFVAERVARLRSASTADESAELMLELLSTDFEHLVLLRLHRGVIRPWLGRGPELMPERLRRLRLELSRAAIFLHLANGGSFFYGRLPAMFSNLQLLRCWNGSLDRDCALFPIRIADHMVAVLYADDGGDPLTPAHLATLQKGTDLLTSALVGQILSRKKRRR